MAQTNLTVTAMWENDADYQYMDELRTEHYPPERLFNGAHISLFARLTVPPHRRVQVMNDLRQVAASQRPFHFKFQNKPSLWGKAVVVRLDSRPLTQVRNALNKKFTNILQCSLRCTDLISSQMGALRDDRRKRERTICTSRHGTRSCLQAESQRCVRRREAVVRHSHPSQRSPTRKSGRCPAVGVYGGRAVSPCCGIPFQCLSHRRDLRIGSGTLQDLRIGSRMDTYRTCK